jgi:hypothetical protein
VADGGVQVGGGLIGQDDWRVIGQARAMATRCISPPWLPMLVPFGLGLGVPLAALAWLRTDQNIEEPFQAPSSPAQEPTPRLDHENTSHTARRVA